MLGGAVDVRVECGGADAELRGGPGDAKGDLAAVCYYYGRYGCNGCRRRRRRRRRGRGGAGGGEEGARRVRGPEGEMSVGAFEGSHCGWYVWLSLWYIKAVQITGRNSRKEQSQVDEAIGY